MFNSVSISITNNGTNMVPQTLTPNVITITMKYKTISHYRSMFGLGNDVNKHVIAPNLRYNEYNGSMVTGIVVVFTVFDFLIFVCQIKHAGTVTDTDNVNTTVLDMSRTRAVPERQQPKDVKWRRLVFRGPLCLEYLEYFR